MSLHAKVSFLLLLSFLLILFTETNLAETQVYSWGKNDYAESGQKVGTLRDSSLTPLSNSYLTKMFLTNPELSYQKAFGLNSTEISLNVQHIINGYYFNYYVVNFSNQTSHLGQHVFTCGSNIDGISGIHDQPPPYISSELNSIYVYRPDQRNSNLMTFRNISHIQCGISCLACMTDGSVFWKNGTRKEWSMVNLPSNVSDPFTGSPFSENDYKCKMVAVAGNVKTSETLFILTEGGLVFSWGYYNYGTRGYGDDSLISWEPQLITSIGNVTYINGMTDFIMNTYSTSKTSVTFVNRDGEMFMMGMNSNGFGSGIDNNPYSTPVKVPIPSQDGKVVKTCYGYEHVIVITDMNMVYGFGMGSQYQINPSSTLTVTTPMNLTNLFSNPVVDCSCSTYASMIIDNQNDVYSWGQPNVKGSENSGVQLISSGMTVLKASLLTDNGYIQASDRWYAFGYNNFGQSCIGDPKVIQKPTLISGITIDGDNPKIKAGYGCTVLLDNQSPTYNNYFWGNCTYGMDLELPAVSDTKYSVTFIDTSVFLSETFTDIALTESHVLLLNSVSGKGYEYGEGGFYQLGTNSDGSAASLISLSAITGIKISIQSVAAGYDHSLILFSNGTVMGSGRSYEGQIPGFISFVSRYSTVDLSIITNSSQSVRQVYAGHKLTFMLTQNGIVYGCGINRKNEITTSNSTKYATLTRIELDYSVSIKKLAVGSHVIALRTDGTVAMFKNGGFILSIPEFVTDIFASHTAYYFITKSGNVYAMGENQYYQTSLLDGSLYISTPTLLYTRAYFDNLVPFMIAPGRSFASALAKTDWYCSGIASTNLTVCSGRGACEQSGICSCMDGYYGDACQYKKCYGTSVELRRPSMATRLCDKINKYLK